MTPQEKLEVLHEHMLYGYEVAVMVLRLVEKAGPEYEEGRYAVSWATEMVRRYQNTHTAARGE